ncbi:hypothetical protein [Streptomyces sp. MBT65]|uniref:hypothetical protein n=1 Tax=Streptomyces sp. MBT65 TaxID=1488395 RepID=UPI0035B44170
MTEELNWRRVPVVRLDPGDFPAGITVTARLDGGGLSGSMRTATRLTALDHVRSVYWRRPRTYAARLVWTSKPLAGAQRKPATDSADCSPPCPQPTMSTTPGTTATLSTSPRNWPQRRPAASIYRRRC